MSWELIDSEASVGTDDSLRDTVTGVGAWDSFEERAAAVDMLGTFVEYCLDGKKLPTL